MWTGAKTWGSGAGLGFCEGQRQEASRGVEGGRLGSWWLRSGRVFVAVVGVIGLFGGAQGAVAAECPNEARRAEQSSTSLPDCRAYEMVSPGSNPKVDINGEVVNDDYSRASTTGNRFAYQSFYPAANALTSSFFYLATRGEHGWSTQPAAPQDTPGAAIDPLPCEQELNFSLDLSKSVLGDGFAGEPGCQSAEEVLVPGAPSGYRNLFLREDATAGAYRLVDVTPETAVPGDAHFVAASADFSHIIFTDGAQLTPEAPAGASLYEWAGGVVHLVTVLPSGEPTQGTIAPGPANAQAEHAVSPDGERVYFYSQGNLYMRVNAVRQPTAGGECSPAEPEKACTVQIDKSTGSGASGGGVLAEGSADGAKVFFSDQSKLTGDSTAEPGAPDIYEYDVQSGQLSDLTVNGSGAGFLGAGEDGSYVYFTSPGVLTGAEESEHHEKAEPGKSNMYMRRAGSTTFVAGDSEGGQVSPNGRFFLFASRTPLTGYDNTPAKPQECQAGFPLEPVPCSEVFLYDANTGRLSCASCGPERSVSSGDSLLAEPTASGESHGESRATYRRRQIDNEGRVFFDTPNALVPQDNNGVRDVYEYWNGQIHLISSGTDPSGASFYEASRSGNDVFFVTAQSLLRSDTNNADSVYDARVGGGFFEPPPAPECEEEACRAAGTVAPGISSLATASFAGPGNPGAGKPKVTGCKKGFVRKRGKCLRRKHHAKKHHRSHKRAANNSRRASR
jgi:hypothetical protein